MKQFRQMPDHAVPKEWAPDEGEPKYVKAMRLVRRFHDLKHFESIARFAVAFVLLECVPVPIYARWALAIVAVVAYSVLWFMIKRVQQQARAIEELHPAPIKVREEQEEKQEPQDGFFKEQKA